MIAPANSLSVHGIIHQFSSPPVRLLMFFAALVVAGVAVIKVIENVSAIYGPAYVGAASNLALGLPPCPCAACSTVSATVNIAYEPPLPSEVIFGPELRTYSQLAVSLSGQRAAIYWSIRVPVFTPRCAR
jgi:hypothetical protein